MSSEARELLEKFFDPILPEEETILQSLTDDSVTFYGLLLKNFLGAQKAKIAPVSGQWTTPDRPSRTPAGKAEDQLFLMWLDLTSAGVIDSIGIEVTAGVAASNVRLGIYEADSNGLPGNLLVDAGVVDTSAAGLASAAINARVDAPGIYLAFCRQTAANPTVQCALGHDSRYSRDSGLVITQFDLNCFSAAGVAGALPAVAPNFAGGLIGDATAPIVVVHFA